MSIITIPSKISELIGRISGEHGLTASIVEVSVGSALLAYGVASGLPETEKLWIRFINPPGTYARMGARLAGVIGQVAVIGTTGMVSVPAYLLAMGGGILAKKALPLLGKTIDQYLLPDPDVWQLVLSTGCFALGTGLLIDGLRRGWKEIKKDSKPMPAASLITTGEEEQLALSRFLMQEFQIEPHLADEFRAILGQFTLARLVGRATADVIATFKGGQSKYESTCRSAICHAVEGKMSHAFGALRVAASVNDNYARHHHIYGLIHATEGRLNEARWELAKAQGSEPNDDTRQRTTQALAAL